MAANDIIIRGTTYPGVPTIGVKDAEDTSQEHIYRDTSDATLQSGNQMLAGVKGYGPDGLINGQIPEKSASDLSASGGTVTVPAGHYAESASKSVASGSASTPATTIQATPEITLNSSTGEITASVDASQSITPAVTPGYVASGSAGNVRAQGSDTLQLQTKAAATITPSTSDQTIAAGQFLLGPQVVKGDANLQSGNIVEGASIFGVPGSAKLPSITQDASGGLHIS